MKNTLFVIDAYNLIYRMFYAIPEITTRSWEPVNAIFGVAKFLKWLAEENPLSHIVVATDVGKSFRADLFWEYKWTRERMPDNLRSQIDGVFAFFQAADITVLSQEGYEADDIIGSIAADYKSDHCQVVIISSDKDLCQFVVDDHVHIYDAMKRKFMKESDVIEKFGVPASQVCDYLAIVGDSSDNIPGIAGFGPKKAIDLLSKYENLQGIYRELWVMDYDLWTEIQIDTEKFDASDLSQKLKQGLLDSIENAFLSQKLATIVTDLEVPLEDVFASDLATHIWASAVIEFLKKYEFKSLIPTEYRETQKEVTLQKSIQISHLSELQDILSGLSGKVYFALSLDRTIVFSHEKNTYTLDLKHVDALEDILVLFHKKDIEIVGYDLKEDIRQMLSLQKPLQVEGQGKLF